MTTKPCPESNQPDPLPESVPARTSRDPWENPQLVPLDLGAAETQNFTGAFDADLGPKPS